MARTRGRSGDVSPFQRPKYKVPNWPGELQEEPEEGEFNEESEEEIEAEEVKEFSEELAWHPFDRERSATGKSAALLLQFPFAILLNILHSVLEPELFSRATVAPFYRFLSLTDIILSTTTLRAVCSSWAGVVRGFVLSGSRMRGGHLCLIRNASLARLKETFPILRDCVLELGDPNNIERLELIRISLQSLDERGDYPLDFITAISWNESPQEWTAGYNRYCESFKWRETCQRECRTRGIPFVSTYADEVGHLGYEVHEDIRTFILNELLALSYFHSQLLREILNHLPRVRYLEMPSFLLLPLLSDSYLHPSGIPQCSRLLRRIGVDYENYGKSFHSVLDQVEYLHILVFPNPLYGKCVDPFAIREQDIRENWASTLRMECFLESYISQCLQKFRVPDEPLKRLRGLGFRGTEFDTAERKEQWLDIQQNLDLPSLQEVHIVQEFSQGPLASGLFLIAPLLNPPSSPM